MRAGAAGLTRVLATGLLLASVGPVRASPSASASALPPRVAILDDEYGTPRVDVAVGVGIVFEQRGRHSHTITADQGGFDTGDLAPGEKIRIRFPAPGAYRYHCARHGAAGGYGMSAVIVVGGAETPPGPQPRTPRPAGPATVHVPKDQPTIQKGVDAALPGDLVLVGPGTYEESVVVSTPGIEVRGADRNAVVLDGGGTKDTGLLIGADGVTVQNLTVRRYRTTGVLWWGVKGFRASYVSAGYNGSYGVRAFGSEAGLFDHLYATGHHDAGVSVASCSSCATTVMDSVVERNAVGILVANADGGVTIVRSVARDNTAGIVAAPFDSMPGTALRGVRILGNLAQGNGPGPPADPLWLPTGGAGIIVAGGIEGRVERNRVDENRAYGVLLTPGAERTFRVARSNRVAGNRAWRNGQADVALAVPAGRGNCLAGNRYGTSRPPGAQLLSRCGSPFALLGGGDPGVTADRLARVAHFGHESRSPRSPRTAAPAPLDALTPQPSMPGAEAAPPQPAIGRPGTDPGPTPLPGQAAAARSMTASRSTKEAQVFGVKLTDPLALVLGLYAYLLPLALYAAWVSVSMWDLARRETLSGAKRVGLAAIVLGVPLLGPVAYLVAGAKTIPRGLRLFLAFGGLGLYALLAAVSFSLGRI